MAEDRLQLLLATYTQCFEEKRHYDILSWTIGGALTLIDTLIVGSLLKVAAMPDKLLLASLTLGLSFLWWAIYERNRFWGEVCNETAREIEKQLAVDGIGHAYMRGALRHEVTLANTGIDGTSVTKDGVDLEPRTERDRSRSIHISIRVIIFTPPLIAFLLAARGLTLTAF